MAAPASFCCSNRSARNKGRKRLGCHAERSEASDSYTERLFPVVCPTQDRASVRVTAIIMAAPVSLCSSDRLVRNGGRKRLGCHAERSEASDSCMERLFPLVCPTQDRASVRVTSFFVQRTFRIRAALMSLCCSNRLVRNGGRKRLGCLAERSVASGSYTRRLFPLVCPTQDRASVRVTSTLVMQFLDIPKKYTFTKQKRLSSSFGTASLLYQEIITSSAYCPAQSP